METTTTSTPARDAVFRAVADPTRRLLLDMLREGGRDFQELLGAVEMTKGGLSQHLRVLQDVGLVVRHAHGRRASFELTPAPLAEVEEWVAAYARFWDEALGRLDELAAGDRTAADDVREGIRG